MGAKTVVLQNEACTATLHTTGGALVDFRLQLSVVNPLNFCWEEGEKKSGTVFFRGHFLCMGHWGDPSQDEASSGHIKHGDFNRLEWKVRAAKTSAFFAVRSSLEWLQVDREVALDASAAVLFVKESVQNTNTIGRLYNMVQHPTLAGPFLGADTIVDCNATLGFDYAFPQYTENIFGKWPEVETCNGGKLNLVRPDKPYSSVFSFIVNPADEWGRITAFSPGESLVIGYLWRRSNYPWIAHWLHFDGGRLQYRGMEFGTTGVHKPVKEIWDKKMLQLLGEATCCFLDTGETHQRAYLSFLVPVRPGFRGVQQVWPEEGKIVISEKESGEKITILHQPDTTHVI